jgi:probable rRNA maturation factor
LSDFEIDIFVEDVRWTESVDLIDALAARAIYAAMATLKSQSRDCLNFSEVSLALVSDAKIKNLNAQYRHKDKPTNVLSFPGAEIDGFTPLLGDIVLAFETVVRESNERSLGLNDHVVHLIVHGFLHLLGYDHEIEADAETMESIEIKTLEGLGITNPYVKGQEQ